VRRHAGRERLRKAGLTPEDIARIAMSLPATLQGDRDRCIILLGYATSLRRATLASLNKSDIDESAESITIYPNRHASRGAGSASILVPRNRRSEICPVTAYRRWIDASGIDGGPLFRWITRHGQLRVDGLSDKAVAIVVKRAVALVGKDPGLFAANSLRAAARTA
jgi:integrase